jgi:aspartyl-tRNA(Asn)/glutamyl-tRNA(Gln) amidotransferase subunit C
MISVHEIENLAKLARIKIDDDEKSQLIKEIDSILTYIDQIKKASIIDGNAEGRVGAVKNVTRSDQSRIISAKDREGILAEVPDREGDYIAVKKIL